MDGASDSDLSSLWIHGGMGWKNVKRILNRDAVVLDEWRGRG